MIKANDINRNPPQEREYIFKASHKPEGAEAGAEVPCNRCGGTYILTEWNIKKKYFVCRPCQAEMTKLNSLKRAADAGVISSRTPSQLAGATPALVRAAVTEDKEIIGVEPDAAFIETAARRFNNTSVETIELDFTHYKQKPREGKECADCPACGKRGEVLNELVWTNDVIFLHTARQDARGTHMRRFCRINADGKQAQVYKLDERKAGTPVHTPMWL
jgi:DNA-directed RNA polymerase subunit M/transcription elongation factor TFIIS